MFKMKKGSITAKSAVKNEFVPHSRYMTLDSNVMRKASWLESFGSITLGSSVAPTKLHVNCYGMRGDMYALAFDYRKGLDYLLARESTKKVKEAL